MLEIPKIISVDDHVVEPPDLWVERLPSKYKDKGPRVERDRAILILKVASSHMKRVRRMERNVTGGSMTIWSIPFQSSRPQWGLTALM